MVYRISNFHRNCFEWDSGRLAGGAFLEKLASRAFCEILTKDCGGSRKIFLSLYGFWDMKIYALVI